MLTAAAIGLGLLAVWVAVGVVVGTIIGRAIRAADEHNETREALS